MKNENNQKPNPSFFTPLLPQIPGGEQNLLKIATFGAKANKIKTNQTKNIVVNNTKFNAKTDSVNYFNNKLKLKNSKFLNKNINLTKGNLDLNKLNPKNLLLTLASNYLDLNNDTNLNKVNNKISDLSPLIKTHSSGPFGGETSVISSSLNNLDFTSNKYIIQILKNKKAIFKLEEAKVKKELEGAKLKIELKLANLKNELKLALFLRKIEIGRLIIEIKSENLIAELPKVQGSPGQPLGEKETILETLEVDRSLIQLELDKLIIKLDRDNFKNKLERGNLIKDLKLANSKKELELDKPFTKTFAGYYHQQNLKKSFFNQSSKKRILLKLNLIKEQLNLAGNLELNNLNRKIDNFKFDFNKKIILNKNEHKGLDLQNNTLIHNYLNYFTKSNNIININPNLTKKYGIILKYNRSIGFNFLNKINVNNTNWLSEYKEETYKLLFYFFKSIYCLISKPTIIFEQDKITIRLFYYSFIEKYKYNSKKRIGVSFGQKEDFKNIKQNQGIKNIGDLLPLEDKINSCRANKKNKFFNLYRNIKPLAFARAKSGLSFGEPRRIRLTNSNLKFKENLINKNKVLLKKNTKNLGSVFYDKFLIITNILSLLFNKPVNLEITRVHNLTFDTNILANAIQLVMKNKNLKPLRAISDIYAINNIKGVNAPLLKFNTKLIAFLSGLNININGRLLKDAIVPKNTVKKFERGASAPGKVNYIDTSFITKKNRKGAYNIKVKSAQNFMF